MVKVELLRLAAGMALCLVLAPGPAGAEEQEWRLAAATGVALEGYAARAPQVILAGFSDPMHGIALCLHGQVLETENGGQIWHRTTHPPFAHDLEGLEILDRHAWASGGIFVWKSENGGMSWQALPNHGPMSSGGRHLSFADDKAGWWATASALHASRNGGIDWAPVDLPEEAAGQIAAVHLLSEKVGFVLLYSGVLLATDDGGKSWDRRPVPIEGGKPVGVLTEVPIEAVRFQNPEQGILVLYTERPRRGFYVLATEDGGMSWKDEMLPPNGVTVGSVFLSRDGRTLTLNDLDRNRVLVYQRGPVAPPPPR